MLKFKYKLKLQLIKCCPFLCLYGANMKSILVSSVLFMSATACAVDNSQAMDNLANSLYAIQTNVVHGEYMGTSTTIGATYKNAFKYTFGSTASKPEIWIKDGDLLEQGAAVVVDPANTKLSPGAGVSKLFRDNAEHYAQSKGIKYKNFESDIWRKVLTGLPAEGVAKLNSNNNVRLQGKDKRHTMSVIHVAGPQCTSGVVGKREEKLLHDSYYSALQEAELHAFASIAFPFISGGIFGCGTLQGAQAGISGIMDYFLDHPHSIIQRVDIVLFKNSQHQSYFIKGMRNWVQKTARTLVEDDTFQKQADMLG